MPIPVPPGMGKDTGGIEVDEEEIDNMLKYLNDARDNVRNARRATSCTFCEQKIDQVEQTLDEALKVLNKTAMVYRELKRIKKNGGDIDDVSEEVKNIIRQQG